MKLRIPFEKVMWPTSLFLIGTLLLSLTAVPAYIYYHGLDLFYVVLFLVMFIFSGLSITLGYHRLFAHLSFKARTPVKLFTLLFGASAFENSALWWASGHRRHHKHVDTEEDPYDINMGFWAAHMGWLMFKLKPNLPLNNVKDLEKDPLVMWQHKYCHLIGFTTGFILPAALGFLYNGWSGALGGFLFGGVLRVVCVQHATFFINSLCHTIGKRPYSTDCTARDSWIMALFTFGEGYHNYHHEFQHDYRNGVKPWQFDPTKWSIYALSKLGLVSDLRKVPEEKILLAEVREAQRLIAANFEPEKHAMDELSVKLRGSIYSLQEYSEVLADRCEKLTEAVRKRINLSSGVIDEWRGEVRAAMQHLRALRDAGLVGALPA